MLHESVLMSRAATRIYDRTEWPTAVAEMDRGVAELSRSHRSIAVVTFSQGDRQWSILAFRDAGEIYVKTALETYPAGFPAGMIEQHVRELRRAARHARTKQNSKAEITLQAAAEMHQACVEEGVYAFPYDGLRPILERLAREGGEVTEIRDVAVVLAGHESVAIIVMEEAGIIPPMATPEQLAAIEETARRVGMDPSVIDEIVGNLGGTVREREKKAIPKETMDWAEEQLIALGFDENRANRALINLEEEDDGEEEEGEAVP